MINVNAAMKKPLIIIGLVFGAILGLTLLAAFTPLFFGSTRAITENVTAASTGSAQADSFLHGIGPFIPMILGLSFIGLIFVVVAFEKSKS